MLQVVDTRNVVGHPVEGKQRLLLAAAAAAAVAAACVSFYETEIWALILGVLLVHRWRSSALS